MSLETSCLYEFGEFRLVPGERILMRRGEPVPVTPKVFEMLCLFVEFDGRLIEKEELMKKIWAGSFVEESNLTFTVRQLRKVLGDDARSPIYIQTVPRHGYRFIAEVRKIAVAPLSADSQDSREESREPVIDRQLPDDAVPDPAKPDAKVEKKSLPQFFAKRYHPLIIALALMLASLPVFLILSRNQTAPEVETPLLAADFKSEQLTGTGGVRLAAISPNGETIVYSNEMDEQQSIWLRRLETSESIQILPNSNEHYTGLAFSHDGESIFFVRGARDKPQTIYRVSLFGGIPKEVVGGAQPWFSISPDDRRISFVRCPNRDEDFCSLYVADIDGANERRILTRPRPVRMSDNQFAPDGKSIAVALGQSRDNSLDFGLLDVDVETGEAREITSQKFFNIRYLRWLPERSGILMTAFERFYSPSKLYQVSMPTGEVKMLTKDSGIYNRISLDKDFKKLVATQTFPDFHLWIAPAENADSAKPCCSATGGLDIAPSGKIFYGSITDGNRNIWAIDPDGSNHRQLTSNQSANWEPRVSPDERFIYFTSNRAGTRQIWRMNTDGSNQTQISEGEGGIPIAVAPDGKSIYYETSLNSNLGKLTLGADGKYISTVVSNARVLFPALDSTGATAAYFAQNSEGVYQISLLGTADGKIFNTFALAEQNAVPGQIRWSDDGEFLFYLIKKNARGTIWRLALETGKTEKFADLGNEGEPFDFAISADGKTLAFIRGRYKSDAILIEGLK